MGATAKVIYEFPVEGVVVVVPDGETVISIPIPSLPTSQPGFELIRAVINLKLINSEGHGMVVFDPPIQISVQYNDADLERAAGIGRPLKLAYFTGIRWVPFTVWANCFHLVPKELARVGVVYVHGWCLESEGTLADPAVGWGA